MSNIATAQPVTALADSEELFLRDIYCLPYVIANRRTKTMWIRIDMIFLKCVNLKR